MIGQIRLCKFQSGPRSTDDYDYSYQYSARYHTISQDYDTNIIILNIRKEEVVFAWALARYTDSPE
jgi:hypothetical protein